MKVATTAPAALEMLWKEKLFAEERDVKAVEGKLAEKGYNFNDKALMNALRRAKFLTRKGPKGKYTYIQKHPFVEAEKNGKK